MKDNTKIEENLQTLSDNDLLSKKYKELLRLSNKNIIQMVYWPMTCTDSSTKFCSVSYVIIETQIRSMRCYHAQNLRTADAGEFSPSDSRDAKWYSYFTDDAVS